MHLVWKLAKGALRALTYGVAGGFVVSVVILVFYLNDRPDLKVWHTARLDAEFTIDSGVQNFLDYVALEDRLFEQLDVKVYDQVEPGRSI